jgi:hypothetical protein
MDDSIRCSECRGEVDEFTAIKERWGFWSDGCSELLPYCPESARREFGGARLSERLSLILAPRRKAA